ncbi:ROK family transcriptional regulator [Mesobacillus subterraneus]|uniref:ROK family transcriptional regulator n=1 Tax=Mesobacillus subterraneus TaxID=285983 RepID=UPI00203F9D90|nr:ROK family transcriptional regulator [Mesobacillus subterraneus]MCM3667005.1 ROK family transcriptional regulator [Mesobacillus subterraneus]MCM3685836.1 ROK family transcriptional regulator [Mesobacillus subterraneus]
MRKTGDLKLIQELNQSIILDIIRKSGPISRSDIAKKTKLSPTTVASAVNDLINDGMVMDGEAGQSSGGRRPILVNFVPDSKYIIGVSITNTNIMIANLNLDAEVKEKKQFPIELYGQNDLVDFTAATIESYIQGLSDIENCIGISIIVPGIVDAVRGLIRFNSKLQLHDVKLRDIIQEKTGIKTWLDNDANAIALAEKQFGDYRDRDNIIYIQLGEGVGSGIVLNNNLFRGRNGGAGEFGHISINRSGTKCDCGNLGCLENYVSWPAIYSKVLTAITRGKRTMIMELANHDVRKIDQRIFFSALQENDPLAKSIADETASYFATGLVTLVHLFNPEIILIGWDTLYGNTEFVSFIREEVKKYTFDLFTDDLEIELTTLGEDYQLMGAAAIALQDIFDFSI